MPTLTPTTRCPGRECPSREICQRYVAPRERTSPGQIIAALYARREDDAAACSEYVERTEACDHA